MQDGRPTKRPRPSAVAKALQALGQTARLCQDASDFLEGSDAQKRIAVVTAASFATQVESQARNRGVEVSAGRIPASARLALAGDVARIGDAVVHVASTAGTRRPTLSMKLTTLNSGSWLLTNPVPRQPTRCRSMGGHAGFRWRLLAGESHGLRDGY